MITAFLWHVSCDMLFLEESCTFELQGLGLSILKRLLAVLMVLGRYVATIVLVGFVLNELWEMAQMSAYRETAGHSWMSTLGFCTRAAVGDVGIILGIYAVGALAANDLSWGLCGRWNIYATAAFLGLVYATLVEHSALAVGRWSYTENMPMVSMLDAGLWPILQMTLLPPLTFWIARQGVERSATKGESL